MTGFSSLVYHKKEIALPCMSFLPFSNLLYTSPDWNPIHRVCISFMHAFMHLFSYPFIHLLIQPVF